MQKGFTCTSTQPTRPRRPRHQDGAERLPYGDHRSGRRQVARRVGLDQAAGRPRPRPARAPGSSTAAPASRPGATRCSRNAASSPTSSTQLGERLGGHAADALVGGAELDRPARGRGVAQLVGGERLARLGRHVLGDLEAAEAPAEVGQRRGADLGGGRLDLGDEDDVRARATCSVTRHSRCAIASASSGWPHSPTAISTPSNLSPPLRAKRIASSPWSSPRMLTANAPVPAIAAPVADSRFMQTSSIGGSSASEVTALAVVPWRRPSAVVVMTVTPLAKWPMTLRNSPGVSRRVRSRLRARPPWLGSYRRTMPRPPPKGEGIAPRTGRWRRQEEWA